MIRLDGWSYEDLVASSPVAMHVRWPSFRIRRTARFGPPPPSEPEQVRARDEQLERIRSLFADAEAYRLARRSPASGARPAPTLPRLEAMLAVLDGIVPVVIHASEIRQIRNALEWAEQQNVRIVLAGSGDLWRAADELARRRVDVILTSVLALPRRADEPYDVRFTEAAALHAAGVRFCIAGSGNTFAAANARNLPHHAAMAAAFGLPPEEAIRAITRYPAEILGLGDSLGTLEPGKSASIVLIEGDPLEIRSRVHALYIDGRPIDPRANKHDRLYERYRDRPAAP
jgi:imidazolonepropionase-like amidohydrolase